MRKILFIAIALSLVAATVYAGKATFPVDGLGIRITGFAPDGKKTVSLTVNSVTKDMTDDIKWSAYTPTACKFRAMSTATKAGPQLTLAANATTERAVNMSTPFINFSGCTSGELQRQ